MGGGWVGGVNVERKMKARRVVQHPPLLLTRTAADPYCCCCCLQDPAKRQEIHDNLAATTHKLLQAAQAPAPAGAAPAGAAPAAEVPKPAV